MLKHTPIRLLKSVGGKVGVPGRVINRGYYLDACVIDLFIELSQSDVLFKRETDCICRQ